MEFTKRLNSPGPSDKEWIHYSAGGSNQCIKVNGNSCLPNCVGYAWGRMTEILGHTPDLSCGNAEDWWDHNDSFERGDTPKLGAVVCWSRGQTHNGADGAGHVAIVEEIHDNGDIVISQSGYINPNGATYFNSNFSTRTVSKSSGYSFGSAYRFQGFIYCGIDFDDDTPSQEQPDSNNDCEYSERDVVRLNDGVKWANNSTPASWVFSKDLTVKRVDGDILVVSKDGYDGGVTGTVHACNVHRVGEEPEPEPEAPAHRDSLNKGDIVTFTGDTHYTSSYASGVAKHASPCQAEVTVVNNSNSSSVVRKYHLVGDGVYGWVNSEDIAELN